jgi:hypothetical protein
MTLKELRKSLRGLPEDTEILVPNLTPHEKQGDDRWCSAKAGVISYSFTRKKNVIIIA